MTSARAPKLLLRPVEDADIALLFEHQRDPEANAMAAFTAPDPEDRTAFAAKWNRILENPSIVARTILWDNIVAGHITAFEESGNLEVTYWIDRACWGRGVATAALLAFLREVERRPIHARAAEGNPASRRVLEKCGFTLCGEDKGYAPGLGRETREWIFRLD